MKLGLGLLALAAAATTTTPELPVRWDELTASDWPAAERAARTCILPIGILEKHGPHVPIGSDLIQAREWSARAARREYAVVFPDYFYGQINEARHQPGTFALPPTMALDLLQATTDEIGRNGFRHVVIVNAHFQYLRCRRPYTRCRPRVQPPTARPRSAVLPTPARRSPTASAP